MKKLFGFIAICLFVSLLSCKQPVAALEIDKKQVTPTAFEARIRKEKIAEAVYDAVNERAGKISAPALITKSAVASMHESNVLNKPQWEWATLEGFEVAYMPSEDLDSLKKLGKHNENALELNREAIMDRTNKFKLTAKGTPIQEIKGLLSLDCLMAIKGNLRDKKSSFTIHSGGPISVFDTCRLYAWAFAVNGITFEADKSKPNTIILKWADEGETGATLKNR